MRLHSPFLIGAVAVGSAPIVAVPAQSPPPRTYSFTMLNNMMVPDLTLRVYRDGARELLDESRPVSAESPKGFHVRILYDFQAHKLYTLDLTEPSSPCGVQALTESEVPAMYDIITGTELTKGLADAHPRTVGAESINGVPATILEVPNPNGPPQRAWVAVKGGYIVKIAMVPKNGPSQLLLEVRDLAFAKPDASLLAVPAACAKAGAAPAPPPPAPAPAPAGANSSSMQVSSAEANAIPPGFMPPPGFSVVGGNSKMFDYNHVEVSYPNPKGGANIKGDPAGRTWQPFFRLVTPNKTGLETDAAMRTDLKQQGWEILTPSGLLIARKKDGGKEMWFSGAAFAADYRATIVEAGPPPNTLTLTAPAPAVENVADGADFPYLKSFPGAKLVRTVQEPNRTFNAAMPGQAELLVGQPQVRKQYALPGSVSTYEFVAVYRDALTKAGWTIIRTSVGSDAQVIAHYAKNGRDIFAYLAGDAITVADVGAQNEAKKLAADLARDGHVAIYGIYFDTDKATLKPESEVALEHILELMKGNATLKVEVQGHTDNTGTPAHNLPLSDQRASAVTGWLVSHGIAAARMSPKGYGETLPVGDNKTPEGRAKNRRVELKSN